MELEQAQIRRGRLQIGLLALVFFGPLLVAIAWYYLYGNSAQRGVNYGDLLRPPVSLDAKVHFDSGLRGRWTLALLPGTVCAEACASALLDMRQIRLATGREIDRIERAVIAPLAPQGLAPLLPAHPGLIVITGDSVTGASVNAALAGLPRERIYLIDPIGNLILSYPMQPDRKGLLGDLKKLLKLSRIG